MKKLINPVLFIVLAASFRLLPHPANFAPITAMALFGGVYLNKKIALLIPLLAMFLSDIFLGFHDTMPFVYVSFLLVGLIGLWLKNHQKWNYIFAGTLLSSILFFLITNFGVWSTGTMYPKTFSGLFESYLMGIPFFRPTLLGDLFYTGLFFGSYELSRFLLFSSRQSAVKNQI